MPRSNVCEQYHDRVIEKSGADQGLLRLVDSCGLYDKHCNEFFLC